MASHQLPVLLFYQQATSNRPGGSSPGVPPGANRGHYLQTTAGGHYHGEQFAGKRSHLRLAILYYQAAYTRTSDRTPGPVIANAKMQKNAEEKCNFVAEMRKS